jgi:cytochrome c oxidase cbb3-type subunit IV
MEFDLTTLRSAVTLLSFLVFAGIVYWAMSGVNQQRFDEAARLPFLDDDLELPAVVSNEGADAGVGKVLP